MHTMNTQTLLDDLDVGLTIHGYAGEGIGNGKYSIKGLSYQFSSSPAGVNKRAVYIKQYKSFHLLCRNLKRRVLKASSHQ